MHKKSVLGAVHIPFFGMGQMYYTNKGSIVWSAIGLLFGKYGITASYAVSTGSGCGLPKASPSDNYVECQATVPLNLTKSKITGLSKFQRSKLTTLKSGMLFMTPPIFTRMDVF